MSISSGSSQPGPFKSGQKSIDAGHLNRLWSGLSQNAPGVGNFGIRHRQSGGGTSLEVVMPRRIPKTLAPFSVYLYKGKIRVHPGAVNNVVPKIAGTSIDSQPPPELDLPSGNTEKAIVVKCTGSKNQRFPTEATIEIIPIQDASTDTDDYGYLLLATIFPSSQEASPAQQKWIINQIVSGSVWAERNKYTEPETAWYYFYRV